MQNTEPTYLRQTAEPMTRDERMAWVRGASNAARDAGCVLIRASVDESSFPSDVNLLAAHLLESRPIVTLVEGWDRHVADQGEPRFQLTPT